MAGSPSGVTLHAPGPMELVSSESLGVTGPLARDSRGASVGDLSVTTGAESTTGAGAEDAADAAAEDVAVPVEEAGCFEQPAARATQIDVATTQEPNRKVCMQAK